jgi:NSS family neurotransmitter:Na+ symporter
MLWSAAFGQAFFSLSVGTGILLTYGAHISSEQGIPVSSLIVTCADVAVALLAGIVIFPIVFSFGLLPTLGAELAFTTLPQAFAIMPFGWLIAAAFFLMLFFAALTSAVSMLEVSVAAVSESISWSRVRTSALLTGIVFIAGLPSALSYSAPGLRICGIRVLDFMDETIGTLGLPVTALLLAVVLTWFISRDILAGEIGHGMARIVYPICKFAIPVVLLLTTAARLVSGLDYPGMRILPGSKFIGTLMQAEGILLIIAIILMIILAVCWLRACPLAERFRTGK